MDFSFVQLSSTVIASFSAGFATGRYFKPSISTVETNCEILAKSRKWKTSKITLLNSDNKTKNVACPMFKASGKICSETGSRCEYVS